MIKFYCPGCPAVYSVEPAHAWQQGTCPSCKSDFIIPGDEPTPTPTPPKSTRKEFVRENDPKKPAGKLESKRIVAGVLALLFGAFGVHKFVLGYTRAGLIHLVLTFATCGFMKIVAIVEGIIYLTKSDAEFIQTYQIGTKEWF